MVLRKPYAFLIKHFKLIHLIIAALLGYVLVYSNKLRLYLGTVIDNSSNRYYVDDYLKYSIFIFIILAIILCFAVSWLLKYKNKPRLTYKITMIGYAIISILFFITFAYMQKFLDTIPDVKSVRFYRDIVSINIIFQAVLTIIMVVRGLGFDIKKFNFASDIQELNLNESDSEEIEINTQIDTTNINRALYKKQRELGYFFKEFKLIIIPILVIVAFIFGYKYVGIISKKLKVYKENTLIGIHNKVTIKDSYYHVDKTGSYVIISFDISKAGTKEKFNIGSMSLHIGKNEYLPEKNICYKFGSLGNCYKQQFITNQIQNFIIAYDVPNLNIQNAYLIYEDSFDNTYKVKLLMKEA